MKSAQQFKTYWEVLVHNLPTPYETEFTNFAFTLGCAGTNQQLEFKQPSLVYEAQIEQKENIHLICYFPIDKKETAAPALQDWFWKHSPQTTFQWVLQKERDWLKEWKKHFKPFKFAGFNFVPSWLFSAKKFKRSNSIIIEPGMAFGTGHHATTQFAIENLVFLASKNFVKNKSIVDIGSGSGILSIVAEKLGAKSVLANDNDPDCWREAAKTFKLNQAKKAKVTKKQINEINKSYDVVMANIIDGVLIQLKEDLWRITKPGGFIILSGILAEGERAFLQDFCDQKEYKLIKETSDSEWYSCVIEKLK
ncbi:MAG: 50S ribosomal protein L11 methyltransferase [Oligoflexia bacterium]|nr:50S ribosomal protein L11 methyltransferase [Oligoflexia bacterium]